MTLIKLRQEIHFTDFFYIGGGYGGKIYLTLCGAVVWDRNQLSNVKDKVTCKKCKKLLENER